MQIRRGECDAFLLCFMSWPSSLVRSNCSLPSGDIYVSSVYKKNHSLFLILCRTGRTRDVREPLPAPQFLALIKAKPSSSSNFLLVYWSPNFLALRLAYVIERMKIRRQIFSPPNVNQIQMSCHANYKHTKHAVWPHTIRSN